MDTSIHTWVLDHRSQGAVDVARVLTDTGTGVVAYALAAVAGALAAIRRSRRWWLAPLIAVAGLLVAQIVRQALLQVVDRPRPPMADWAAGASGASFPSGHATTSATVAAMFCLAALGTGRRATRVIAAVAVVWAVGVGLTRVYLGVHWPTDVLGGWLLATAFALVGAMTVRLRSDSAGQAGDHDDS
jgi:undecaprenyl-diphosphatase